jgi:hypothetical protein
LPGLRFSQPGHCPDLFPVWRRPEICTVQPKSQAHEIAGIPKWLPFAFIGWLSSVF